jgi:uncharacterized protein with von Willebrand factor type A (vWA) domain
MQVQMLLVTYVEKSQIDLARRRAGEIRKQESEQKQKWKNQGQGQPGHAPNITISAQDTKVSLGPVQSQQARDARIRVIENLFNECPERWTIEPMRSATTLTQGLKGCLAKIDWQQRLVKRLTSSEKWNDVQATIRAAIRDIGKMLTLSKEWRALQYYRLQQYPKVLDEREVKREEET